MKKHIIPILLLTLSSSLWASTATMTTSITRTLLDSSRFGNCMVLLDRSIRDSTNLNCPSRWVSFSCDGTYQPRDIANSMFDSAQMALALDKRVSIQIDDLKKHNGYCFAYRIDVLK